MRRSLIAFLAASTLTVPSSGLFDPLWSLLSGLWSGSYTKEGSGWDPSRRSLTAPQPSRDAGPGVDPSGRSLTTPQSSTDAGAGWDPWGSH